MEGLTSWQIAIFSSWTQVYNSFLFIIPRVVGAVIIFAIGLVLAYWSKRLLVQVLRTIGINKVAKSLGIDEYFKKAELKLDLGELFGVILEWLLILVFFLAAVDILGLKSVAEVLTRVLSYIPNILAAALIFGAGFFVAGFVENLVRGALSSMDSKIAKPVSKFSRWTVSIVAFFAAVEQLQVAQGLINTFFQGLTYTIVLVVGLSIGLGSKDLVSRVLNDWYDKMKK